MKQTGPNRRRRCRPGRRPRPVLAWLVPVLVLAIALLAPAAAQAHISVHPNTVPAGAFATLDVSVPGEQEGAHVTRLELLLPSGLTSAAYQNVPGWTVSEVHRRLSTPIQTDDGPISEEVSQINWTWTGPLGRVDNGQFIEFPLSVAIPDDAAGKVLKFKAVQRYSNGQVVRWIEPSLDDPNPAARINVTASGGAIEDLAGAEAGPQPGQTSGGAAAQGGGATKRLAIAALIVGALGLAAGLGAIRSTRRSRRPLSRR